MSTWKTDIEAVRAELDGSPDALRCLDRLQDRLEVSLGFMSSTFGCLTDPISDTRKIAAIDREIDLAIEAVAGMDEID